MSFNTLTEVQVLYLERLIALRTTDTFQNKALFRIKHHGRWQAQPEEKEYSVLKISRRHRQEKTGDV